MPQPPEEHSATTNKQLQHELQRLQLRLAREQKAGSVRVHNLQRRNTAIEPAEEVEEEGWMTVYLDMMTLMLVMLVVMLSFAGRNQQASTTEPLVSEPVAASNIVTDSEPPAEKPAPETSLDTSGLGDDIEVIINEKTVSFRISSEIIFAEAQADLSIDGLQVLQQLLPVLRSSQHQITVAGHTDNRPIRSSRFPSNWELSGARAGSVVRYLEANGIPSSRLTATGYADTRPVADNDSAASRAKNRRVELILQKQD